MLGSKATEIVVVVGVAGTAVSVASDRAVLLTLVRLCALL